MVMGAEGRASSPCAATSLQALRAAGGSRRRGLGAGTPGPQPWDAHSLPISLSLDFFKQQICLILPMRMAPHGVAGGGNDSRGCSQASAQAPNSLVLPSTSGWHFHLTGETGTSGKRLERGQPQSLGTRPVVRDGCAGPSGPGRGAAPCCRTILGGSWAVAPGVFLPSAPSLHGFSPGRAPVPYRGQRPEFGGGVWLHASFLEKEPHPKCLAEHLICPVSGLHWPWGEGVVLGTAGFVASRLGRGQRGFSMKPAGMCPWRPSTQGVRACPVRGGPKSPPGDTVRPRPCPCPT